MKKNKHFQQAPIHNLVWFSSLLLNCMLFLIWSPAVIAGDSIDLAELKSYYSSITIRANKISLASNVLQSLDPAYLNRLSQKPDLRQRLVREFYTEALRKDFQAYPAHPTLVLVSIRSLYPDLADVENQDQVMKSLKLNYELLNRMPTIVHYRKQLAFCQQHQLSLCQADMGFRLAQHDQFSLPHRIQLLEQAITEAEKIDHRPLIHVMKALKYYFGQIQTFSTDEWYEVGKMYNAALTENFIEAAATIERLYSLEALRYESNHHAQYLLKNSLKAWNSRRHLTWTYYGLAFIALKSQNYDQSLELIRTSRLLQTPDERELHMKSLWLEGEINFQRRPYAPLTSDLLSQALALAEADHYPEIAAKASFRLAQDTKEKTRKHAYFEKALKFYAQSKDLPIQKELPELISELKKANLQKPLQDLLSELCDSANHRVIEIALKELWSDDPRLAYERALKAGQSESEKVRRVAEEMLTSPPAGFSVEELLEMLKNKNAIARVAALNQLWYKMREEIVPIVLPLLKDPDERVRSKSLQVISMASNQVSEDLLLELMLDSNARIRQKAVELFYRLPKSKNLFRTKLLFDQRYYPVLQHLLPMLKNPELNEMEAHRLIEILRTEHDSWVYQVMDILYENHTPEREQQVIRLFEDKKAYVIPAITLLRSWHQHEDLSKVAPILESEHEDSLMHYLSILEVKPFLESSVHQLVALAKKWDAKSNPHLRALGMLIKMDRPEGWEILEANVVLEDFPPGTSIQYYLRTMPCHLPRVFFNLSRYNQIGHSEQFQDRKYLGIFDWLKNRVSANVRENGICRPFSQLQPELQQQLIKSLNENIALYESLGQQLKKAEMQAETDKANLELIKSKISTTLFQAYAKKIRTEQELTRQLRLKYDNHKLLYEISKTYLDLWQSN